MDTTAAVQAHPATPHDQKKYLPESAKMRDGIALCLSAGGFRAALFHLGALARLNEPGVLPGEDNILGVGRQHPVGLPRFADGEGQAKVAGAGEPFDAAEWTSFMRGEP